MGGRERRRPLMVDADVLEELKLVASRRNMSMAAYLRSLFRGVLEAEAAGFFAPMLLRRALAYARIARTGLVLVPASVLSSCGDDKGILEEARREGRRVGVFLRSLGIDVEDALEVVLAGSRVAVSEGGKVLLLPPRDTGDGVARMLAAGLAEGYGLRVEEREDIIIIHLEQS